MAHHTCSKCGKAFSIHDETHNETSVSNIEGGYFRNHSYVHYFICPDTSCKNIDVLFETDDKQNRLGGKKSIWINPISNAKAFPNVPNNLKLYYEEACVVLQFSPRASVALSRACLEAILLEKYELKGKNYKLHELIKIFSDKIENHEIHIDPEIKGALFGIASIGDAGLHHEIDCEVVREDAEAVLEVVELLFQELYENEVSRKLKLANAKNMQKKVQDAKNTANEQNNKPKE